MTAKLLRSEIPRAGQLAQHVGRIVETVAVAAAGARAEKTGDGEVIGGGEEVLLVEVVEYSPGTIDPCFAEQAV